MERVRLELTKSTLELENDLKDLEKLILKYQSVLQITIDKAFKNFNEEDFRSARNNDE